MRPKFKKGDIVQYNCSHEPGMLHWRFLNGSVGIIIDDTTRQEKTVRAKLSHFWAVSWLSPISGGRSDESLARSKETGVLHRILHKIGECDWDEIQSRLNGEVHHE